MADQDDGMLLNFSTDTSSGVSNTSKSKIVGGRWKDRRNLKLQIKRDEREKNGEIDPKLKKKLRDNGFKTDKKESSTNEGKFSKDKNSSKTSKPVQVNSQVVSSLFTSNREIETNTDNNINKYVDDEDIKATNAPSKKDSFDSLNIPELVVNHLSEKMRIKKPTTIQSLTTSYLLNKNEDKVNDLFIHAQTGSGKTLAYLLPILSKILNMNTRIDRKSGCFGLIIAPTRELAQQIYQVCLTLFNCCHYLVPCLLIGGESKKSEKARLRKGSNIIIGTPGRVLDHLQNTKVIKEQFQYTLRYIVLDEGDKLMELGFEETINDILNIIHDVKINNLKYPKLPKRVMHVLCSATKQGKVKQLGKLALNNYSIISNNDKSSKNDTTEKTSVPDQLLQKIAIVPPKLRMVTLAGILNNIIKANMKNEDNTTRTIIFLSCADSVDFHFSAFATSDGHNKSLVGESVKSLSRHNSIFPCFDPEENPNVIFYKLHGSLSQKDRTATLNHFSNNNDSTKGKNLIMFCTDVASRGLDLPNIGTVIELDPPFAVEDHLHRIGRTARAGQKGEAILFLLPGEEEGYMNYIKPYHRKGWKLLDYKKDILQPAFKDSNVDRNDIKGERKKKNTNNEWDANATTWQLNVERRVMEDDKFKSLAVQGYTSHVRAYATHISKEKQYFNIKYLHLGHLAKSFALRERPKNMSNLNSKDQKRKRKASSYDDSDDEDEKPKTTDKENKNKMWKVARMNVREAASEFNFA